MKLYTRTGDQGYTKLVGANVSKDHIRVEAYGTIDEINSFIGLAIAQLKIETTANIIIEELEEIQHELFDTGADLANVTPTYVCKINQKMVEKLEKKIDVYSKEAPELHNFILPGGSSSASTIHICRTVCRRAERHVVHLNEQEDINPFILQYLNRLSDYFFALARVINVRVGISDIVYKPK